MRRKDKMKKIIQKLSDGGNVTSATEQVGISRKTYYEWLKKYPWFREESNEAIRYGKERIIDVATTSLIKQTASGDTQATKELLKICKLEKSETDRSEISEEQKKKFDDLDV